MLQINLKYIFLSILIIKTFFVHTQILDTNTIWSESNIKYSYVANDTVSIDNKTYHKINSYLDTTINYNDIFQTYLIREDGNKVFWREPFLNEDFLIYDLSISEGDSIYVTPMTFDSLDSVLLYCDNVDTTEVSGVMRKRFTMITVNPLPIYNTNTEYWYQGIGSDLGLFSSGHLGLPTLADTPFPKLFCCHKLFDQVYQDSSVNACHGTSASLNKESLQNEIKVYPNPTRKFVQIKSEASISNIELFDVSGKEVSYLYNETNKTIEIKADEGLYFLRIYFDTMSFLTFKIKKI